MSKRWLGLLLLGIWIGRGGVAHAAFNTPAPINFGNVVVNQSSTMNTVLSASGGTNVLVTLALEAGGDCSQFLIVSPTNPVTVNSTTSQTVTVTFTPTSTGSKSCTIDVNDSGGTTIKTFTATGTGINPQAISVDSNALAFGRVDVGTTSATQSVTATNTGDATLTISSATFTTGGSDYVVTGPSTMTLAHNATATWNIACKPSVQGARSGTFEIISDASNTPTFDVSLTCTGDHAALVVNPTSLPFGLVQRGTTQSVMFTLSNPGNVDVTGITGAVSPTGQGYTIDPATPVPAMLAAGGSAMLNVKFAPATNTAGGTAAITFTGSWGNSEPAIATLGLSGTSASINVTPTSLDFGNFRFDSLPTQTYHIANDGGANITISSADFTPDTGTASTEITFTIKKGASTVTLPQTLTPGQQLDVTATARPNNRTGLVSGHVDVITNIAAPAAPRVTLTGNATAAAVMATAMADFGPVDIDATPSPTQTVTLKNTGNATLNYTLAPMTGGSAAFTFTGLPSGGATLAPGTQIDITVTYKPTIERPAGNSETAVLVASLTGVLNGPSTSMISIQGRGIDRHLMVDPAPSFPPTYRNPGDKAPLRNVTVHNTGEALLRITAAMVSSTPAGMELVDTGPVDIPGGGSHDFVVEFAPTTVATVTGQLLLTNNDNARPMAMITLTGIAMDRNLHFGPGTINLGFTAVGIPITVADILSVNNMNPSDGFKIHQITLDDDSVFHIDNAPSDTLLPSGATQTFSITFAPTSIRHFQTTAHLRIDQDPTDEGGMDVQISGDAVFAEVYGGGGCDASGRGRGGGGLAIVLAALGLLRRRRRRRLTGCAVTAAVATLAFAAAAAADGIGIEVFQPTPATTGTALALQAPEVGGNGSWVANAVVSYASNPLLIASVTETGGRTMANALVQRSNLLQLGAAYALLDRFELGAHLPLYQQSGEAGPAGQPGQPARGTATGDLALHAKARLWRGEIGLGTLVAGGSIVVMVPTATRGQFTGSDQPEARFLLLGSFAPEALASRLTVSVNAGPMIRGTSTYANIVEKSGVAWGVGASYRVLDKLWATAELFGESTPSGQRQQPTAGAMPPAVTLSPTEGLAGLSIKPDRRVTVGLAIGRGVTHAAGSPDLRGVLSLSFVSGAAPLAPIHTPEPPQPERDTDGDGIPDKLDKCPRQPEDKDGFQDEDGCPDPDNDKDGIPDAQDKCPNEPEDKDGFQDSDGCPDPDNDGDGIPDALDRCPNQPETINGFQDEDGCPDTADTASVAVTDQASATKAAEDTFNQGRELMKQGKFAAACAEFEQSQRLDPQYGTQYNLAGCYDKLGKLATAWNMYRELARSDTNATRRARAAAQVTALAGRTPKLKLVLTKKPDGVQVFMNGVNANALIGIETPVDFGSYGLVVGASGYRAWRKTVDVNEEGKVVTVVIDLAPAD